MRRPLSDPQNALGRRPRGALGSYRGAALRRKASDHGIARPGNGLGADAGLQRFWATRPDLRSVTLRWPPEAALEGRRPGSGLLLQSCQTSADHPSRLVEPVIGPRFARTR